MHAHTTLNANAPVGDSSRSITRLLASRGNTVMVLLMLLPSCAQQNNQEQHNSASINNRDTCGRAEVRQHTPQRQHAILANLTTRRQPQTPTP